MAVVMCVGAFHAESGPTSRAPHHRVILPSSPRLLRWPTWPAIESALEVFWQELAQMGSTNVVPINVHVNSTAGHQGFLRRDGGQARLQGLSMPWV